MVACDEFIFCPVQSTTRSLRSLESTEVTEKGLKANNFLFSMTSVLSSEQSERVVKKQGVKKKLHAISLQM